MMMMMMMMMMRWWVLAWLVGDHDAPRVQVDYAHTCTRRVLVRSFIHDPGPYYSSTYPSTHPPNHPLLMCLLFTSARHAVALPVQSVMPIACWDHAYYRVCVSHWPALFSLVDRSLMHSSIRPCFHSLIRSLAHLCILPFSSVR